MASSPEKITEKYFNIIEKALQDTIANENTKSLLREYNDVLLDEIRIQKDNETILQESLIKVTTITDPILDTKCIKLQETVTDSEKYIEELRDEVDNLTIQSIADRETLKIENAEKEQQIISYYETEATKLKKQLEHDKKEQEKIEQEIKNQITLEIATRNARLGEIRGNIQRQIVERNAALTQMQNEHKELRKELNLLKAQEKLKSNKDRNTTPKPSNVMEFHNEFLIEKNPTNVSNNRNESNNHCAPKATSAISEYSTTQTENAEYRAFANSFNNVLAGNNIGQSNTDLNQQNIMNYKFHNRNYNSNVFDSEHVLSKYSRTIPSTSVSNGNNSNKRNRLTNEELTYFAEEYDQFNESQTDDTTDTDRINAQILGLVPNPCGIAKTTGNHHLSINKKQESVSTLKNCKVEASSPSNPVSSSNLNDTLMIEDPDMFDRNLLKTNESFKYETNSSDVARNGPTVYVGDARKKKSYKKADRFSSKGNYGEKGTTLNIITGLNSKRK